MICFRTANGSSCCNQLINTSDHACKTLMFPPNGSVHILLILLAGKKFSQLFQVHEKKWLVRFPLTIVCYELGRSLSYTNQRDKNLPKLTKLAIINRRFDGRTPESPAALANQVSVFLPFQLSNSIIQSFLNHFAWTSHSLVLEKMELRKVKKNVDSFHFVVWLPRN